MIIENHSKDPYIVYFKNFIQKDICEEFIKKLSRKKFKQSKTSSGITDHRTNESYFINRNSIELENIRHLIESSLNININDFENPVVQKYSVNQYYLDHFDGTNSITSTVKIKNYRRNTMLLYLNDDFTGGETFFNELNLSIKPKQGSLLIFQNCFNGTNYIHPLSKHSSQKILSGEKWIISFWTKGSRFIDLSIY